MTASNLLTLGLVQHNGSDSINIAHDKSSQGIETCAHQGAKLILLQELHSNFYFPQSANENYFALAETIPGPTTNHFSNLAKKLKIVIVLSLFEKRAKGLYHNTVVVLENDGEIAGIYRKMHIPEEPQYFEKFYFAPGDLGFNPIKTSIANLGVMICWDQWFPEGARIMALKGADILLYPTAIGWDANNGLKEKQSQLDAWITIQRSHAISNGIPVAACNRTGLEQNTLFWGNSFVANHFGEIISQANEKEQTLVCTVDLNKTEKVRQIWPFMRDRRIDKYNELLTRYI